MFSRFGSNLIVRIFLLALTFSFSDHGFARGIAVDSKGNIFIASQKHRVVVEISSSGKINIIAGKLDQSGSQDGKGGDARFSGPSGIALDKNGNIFVSDFSEGDYDERGPEIGFGNNTIRKISPDGLVTTVAGVVGKRGYQDGLAAEAKFNAPIDIAVGADGAVYVVDRGNSCIRKISQAGYVSTLAGMPGEAGLSRDGVGRNARFNTPVGISTDLAGDVYVAEEDVGHESRQNEMTGKIRVINVKGEVTSPIGGSGDDDDGSGNDGSFGSVQFHGANSVLVGRNGDIFVSDLWGTAIKKFGADGRLTEIGRTSFKAGDELLNDIDGSGNDAVFLLPEGVAEGPNEGVYVYEPTGPDRPFGNIRVFSTNGVVKTIHYK